MWQDRGNNYLSVNGEPLLGQYAFLAQPGQRAGRLWIVGVDVTDRAAALSVNPLEDGLIEVDTAKPLDACEVTDCLDAVSCPSQDRGIEGAAPQVVDGDSVAVYEVAARGIERRSGLWIGERGVPRQPCKLCDIVQQLSTVGIPIRRMGHCDVLWWEALEHRDLRHDVS